MTETQQQVFSKKRSLSETNEDVIVEGNEGQRKKMKSWRVNPDGTEGIKFPTPKVVMKSNGLKITDYILGKGKVPKPGSTLQLVYQCLSPDGVVYDSVLKKSNALQFRKGLNQVVPGLDMGIEGMRVGGAREIVVPPTLGYGSDSLGKIPPNQTLVFRVRLVGAL